jgi:hypothetical protein
LSSHSWPSKGSSKDPSGLRAFCDFRYIFPSPMHNNFQFYPFFLSFVSGQYFYKPCNISVSLFFSKPYLLCRSCSRSGRSSRSLHLNFSLNLEKSGNFCLSFNQVINAVASGLMLLHFVSGGDWSTGFHLNPDTGFLISTLDFN